MTNTTDTARLYAAVLARPDCDTTRGAWADALEENAGNVPCPKCEGTGSATSHERIPYGEPDELATVSGPCGRCKATGTASGGNAARAELVRVQMELARREGTQQEREECSWGGTCVCRSHELRRRESAILVPEHRAEWQRVACPTCEDGLVDDPSCPQTIWCDHCTDGDATRRAGVEVLWARGCPETVRCRLADVWEQRHAGHASGLRIDPDDTLNSREWHVTPWAVAIAKAHPVTRWELVDLTSAGSLPRPLYEECLSIEPHPAGVEIAIDVIALACGRLVREAAGYTEGVK